MRYPALVPASCALALALSATAFAQGQSTAPGQQKKEKRAPNQVVETGKNDDARQPSAEEDAAVDRQFGKRVEGVVVSVRPDGTLAAKLDESFMEATTVTRNADGTLTFGHVTGLTKAGRAVMTGSAPKAPALEEK